MSLDDVCEFLATEVDEGLIATGGQVYASRAGKVLLDVALGVDGVDQQVNADSLFAVYCAGKPAFVLGLACLIEDGELSIDDRLGDVVDRPLPARLATLSIEELLNHTSGLHGLDGHLYLVASDAMRQRLAFECPTPSGWRVGHDVGYCQVAPWHLLGLAMESLIGSAADFVRRRVLDPLGVGNDLFVAGMTPEEYAEHAPRLRVNVYLEGLTRSPILVERTRRYRCLGNPAFGNTASARGLGQFYEALLRISRGDQSDGVVSSQSLATLTGLASHGFDPVMDRECGYGLGFMVQMADHAFGRFCHARSFGHSGYGGMTAAFADPEADLVVAFHLNGRVDAESAVTYHRPALIEGIYRSAGLVAGAVNAG